MKIDRINKNWNKYYKMYRKLKRTWVNNELTHMPKFRKVFPELSNINREELANRFIELGMDFYTEERTAISPLIRITLPFAIITMVVMFLLIPINFLITGKWGYELNRRNPRLLNWFRALKLS